MFLRHVPGKYKEEAPVVVTDDNGVDQWMYPGRLRQLTWTCPFGRGLSGRGSTRKSGSPS